MTPEEYALARPDENVPVLPNAISLAGYAAALLYLKGGNPAWCIASILADEMDGRVARATGQTSEFGGALDWGIDVTLTGLFLDRVDLLAALPPITAAQAYFRSKETRPPVLSARAIIMLYTLYKFGWKPIPQRK